MFLGFGALAVSQLGRWRKLSQPPQELSLTEALRAGPGLTATDPWVRLRDVRVPCDVDPQRPNETSLNYRLAADAASATWLVLESHNPLSCDDAPKPRTGLLREIPAAGVVGLAFPQHPWASWPEGRVLFLDVDADPAEGGPKDVALVVVMALLGLFIARFYFAGWRRGGATPARGDELDLAVPGQLLPVGRVLPARALRYHPATAGKPAFVVGFLLVCAGMFALLGSTTFPSGGGSVGEAVIAWGIFLFFAALTGFLVWLSYRFVRVTFRQRRLLQPDRVERWLAFQGAEVALAKGVDVGNRSFHYEHPRDGSTAHLVLGADEAEPWVVEGQVLIVHPPGDPDAHHVVRTNGAPFLLTADDVAAIGAGRADVFEAEPTRPPR
jgi:hypothetical protein